MSAQQGYPYSGQVPVFLPFDYEKQQNGPDFLEFAQQFFNKSKTGGLLTRKTLSPEQAISFNKEHTNDPLLNYIPKTLVKEAMQIQKAILHVTDVRETKTFSGNHIDLIKLIKKDETLIDEAYCVCVKQTTGSDGEAFINTMKFVQVLAKFLCPSKELIPYVISHFAKQCKRAESMNSECYENAAFAYIRVNGRCHSHNNAEMHKHNTKHALDDIHNPNIQYYCSLEEHMWHQRSAHPYLCIPYFLVRAMNKFFDLGAERSEGIFRLPGNMGRINDAPKKINHGDADCFEGLDAKDMGTLIKQWFRTMDGGAIPEDFAIEHIYKQHTAEEMPGIADSLPPLSKYTLMYLVGALKRLAQHQEVTSMGSANLAMTFAMNMSYVDESEGIKASQNNSYMHFFLSEVINHWNTDQMYPLPENVL